MRLVMCAQRGPPWPLWYGAWVMVSVTLALTQVTTFAGRHPCRLFGHHRVLTEGCANRLSRLVQETQGPQDGAFASRLRK